MAIRHTMQLLPAFIFALALVLMASAAATETIHLKFYMHDIVTGGPSSPATAVQVIKGVVPLANDPTTYFGDMYVIDDLVTEGPDAASPAVGRAQGFFQFASMTEYALLLTANFVFTAGSQNGSSVAVLSRDVIFDSVRELPIVGGTGGLRGATGYGLLRTHSVNTTTRNAVLTIDMYLRV
ncbi:dirigent protein 21-like [Triticum dicoccoides]|uniref:dirigent protein 21-like n=1 Tax=Triticum dicoccoides TaxID=85692 RepID=UPI00188FF315|nr:dirigent protein 21-like [Triticum dicoccoides]